MDKSINRKKANIALGVMMLITFIGIFALNHFFPLYTDDWKYAFVYGRDWDRVAGFLDVIESQYNHYFTWGGRSVAHTIAQSLLYMGPFLSDLLNSISYAVLITLIYLIADYKWRVNIFLYLGISAMIWFLIPDLLVCIAWITGSANYLWGCMLVVSFTFPYCMYYLKGDHHKKKDRIARCVLLVLWGIVAGWTNENLVAGLLYFLFMYIVILKFEKRTIPKWVISGFIGVVIGCLFMLLAPGNFIRNAIELQTVHGITKETMDYSYYFYRMVSVIKSYLVYGILPTIIYILALIAFWWKGQQENKRSVLRLSLLFFSMAIVAMLVMAAAPIFPERVWFGIIVLIIIAISLLCANLDFSYTPVRIANYVIWIPLIIFFITSYLYSLRDVMWLNDTFDRREAYICEEKKKGIEDFVFYDRFEPYDAPVFTQKVYDIPNVGDDLWEKAYAKYYGIRSIKIESQFSK
ncbi:hypothetical protein M2451_000347 [Dysgonomonas sp. PFB1-18]|uniref:DUF3329 domain-containing protein n=1 Tax=unclassified Dysgonomonas TaxID=2630389 RepID=UPI0024748CCD|nr:MULTISPECIES: DUF6056 family protein [unclassified Dysgonomonas]MDH6307898.1 hypothetical protein [Dysgonomonas sp. PF1-14]MDH6337816.1 hypothetical protein [Dysgonomonas sp. PF1-16]MDH6379040.1 hypothetical protein [Dysgonomonas sp. PFB1-18]MDH6396675.1 hypothetical protein [Dysgonomonas sp. PF1-23]